MRIYDAPLKRACSGLLTSMLLGAGSSALAAPVGVIFDETDPSAVINARSITQVADGVAITMRGYQIEIDGAGNETVYGPAPTTEPSGRKVFNYNPRNLAEPGIGFVALPDPDFMITETDLPGGGLIIPGFDSVAYTVAKSMEWMEIQFSQAVDISFIDVDDASNYDRSIWAVGLDGMFDYTSGLSSAIGGNTVVNSQDDASDGAFRHAFSPMIGMTSLLIGSAPTFDLGDIEGQNRRSQFFITGLGFEVSETDDGPDDFDGIGGPATIPEPGTLVLFGLGLVGLGFAQRPKAI